MLLQTLNKKKSQHNLQAHLKTAPSAHRPKFLKELAKPTQTKLYLKNFQRFKKNKKRKHTADTQ